MNHRKTLGEGGTQREEMENKCVLIIATGGAVQSLLLWRDILTSSECFQQLTVKQKTLSLAPCGHYFLLLHEVAHSHFKPGFTGNLTEIT